MNKMDEEKLTNSISGNLLSRAIEERSNKLLDVREETTTTSSSISLTSISDLLAQYVNLNLVKEMIAHNLLEVLFVCVILTYLIYYFSQISKKPKLIGNESSKFVKFVNSNLSHILSQRFSPLIYFWGTNPQTALFGYLQGQSSVEEMPRSKFRRQYLQVSDAQYLTSNVDLSQHYASRQRVSLELQVDDSMLQVSNMLDENIRQALDQMMINSSSRALASGKPLEADHKSSLSSGSSSDSGVFATNQSSCSSSGSTASLTDLEPSLKCCCKKRNSASSSQGSNSGIGVQQVDEQQVVVAREQLEFGQCALDWHRDSHQLYHKNKLVALISAGMTTGSDKKYVTDTVSTLKRLGYEVCVFIRRGVGGLKLSSARFFSPAKWKDFEAAVMSVREQRPGANLVAIGFSFGSIELCRYLSMSGGRSQVDAALLVSCPFDPEAGGRNMRKRALNRRIDAYLARNLGKQLYAAMFGQESTRQEQRSDRISSLTNYNGSMVDLATLPKLKSLVDFEDNYNRVLQNYPNSEAYAEDSRLQEHLRHIETPTLCLSSEDDFMAPLKLLPIEQIRANPKLAMVLTRRGGHMAFIDGLLWPKRPYFAQRIIASYMGAVKTSLQSKQVAGLAVEQEQKCHHLIQMLGSLEQGNKCVVGSSR